jgi:hypothetical protein
MFRKDYDVANSWGTRHYLLIRRVLGDRKRLYFLKHMESLTLHLKRWTFQMTIAVVIKKSYFHVIFNSHIVCNILYCNMHF